MTLSNALTALTMHTHANYNNITDLHAAALVRTWRPFGSLALVLGIIIRRVSRLVLFGLALQGTQVLQTLSA